MRSSTLLPLALGLTLASAVISQQPPDSAEKARRREQYIKANPPRSSVGLIPLTDLGTGTYKGEEGGLYAGGKNGPPPGHLKAGIRIASSIAPVNGKIVLLSIGFSNPSIEFPAFQKRVAGDPDVNPHLVCVNGCVGSQAAHMIADPQAHYWSVVDQRLQSAGVTREKVEAVWLKEVNPGANPWETERRRLRDDEVSILHILHDRFPNLKTTYVTSRSYSVKLRDLKLFEALVTAALKNGANQMQGFNFQAPNAAPLFDQVRREAVRDAQEKAAVLARELECKPGSPITITEREGIGSNEGGGAGSALGQVGGQMMPEGKIEIWAAVDITFELKDNAAQ